MGAIGMVAIVLGLAGMAARTAQLCGQAFQAEVRTLSAPDRKAVAGLARAWPIATFGEGD